jgi:hypothetical protein
MATSSKPDRPLWVKDERATTVRASRQSLHRASVLARELDTSGNHLYLVVITPAEPLSRKVHAQHGGFFIGSR